MNRRYFYQITSSCFGNSFQVNLFASSNRHCTCFYKLFYTEIVDPTCRQYYIGPSFQNFVNSSFRYFVFSAIKHFSKASKKYCQFYRYRTCHLLKHLERINPQDAKMIHESISMSKTYSRRNASSFIGSSTTTDIPRCILTFCSEKSKHAILAL